MTMQSRPLRSNAATTTSTTTTPIPASDADGATRRRARRGLALYGALVLALSAPIQAVIIRADLDGGANGLVPWLRLIGALMLVPTIASAVARLALGEGFADVSFRLGGRRGRRAIGQALVFPLFAVSLLLNLILASGEEIGWRGYMLTRLIDAGVPRPVLASGLLWGLWHVPLVLWAGYADGPSPLLSAALLLVTTTALSYVMGRLRLETGSVWPAVVLHAVLNVAIQTGFDPAATGARAALWVGETGLLTVLVLVVAAVVLSRGRWTILRHPGERNPAPAGHAR